MTVLARAKVLLAAGGMLAALAGVARDDRRLMAVAILLLVLSVVARLLGRRASPSIGG